MLPELQTRELCSRVVFTSGDDDGRDRQRSLSGGKIPSSDLRLSSTSSIHARDVRAIDDKCFFFFFSTRLKSAILSNSSILA